MKRTCVVATWVLTVLMVSCTKDPLKDLSDDESRIYITQRDNSVDFGKFKTYNIADSVAYLSDNQVQQRATEVDNSFIAAVKLKMQERGYTLVGRNDKPHLGINISRIYTTYQGLIDYSNYYNDYWDPFYWGYGGSSYYFPSYYGVYEVTEGALSIDILNLRDAATTNQIKVIWNGLIRGSGIFNQQKALSQVDALFSQSPYLVSNP